MDGRGWCLERIAETRPFFPEALFELPPPRPAMSSADAEGATLPAARAEH